MRRLALLGVLVLGGCGSGGHSTTANTGTTSATRTTTVSSATKATSTSSVRPVTLARGFHLSSPAFHNNAAIPSEYTCDGAGKPIPLRWSGVPQKARELVLVMRDPDAPGSPFTHWALAGISPRTQSVPAHAIAGANSAGTDGYTPPCPPRGSSAHHYVITVTALSGPSGLRPGFNPDQLRTAAVAIATLVGSYKRQ